MNMEHWWNDNERVTPKYLEKNVCATLYTQIHIMPLYTHRSTSNGLGPIKAGN